MIEHEEYGFEPAPDGTAWDGRRGPLWLAIITFLIGAWTLPAVAISKFVL